MRMLKLASLSLLIVLNASAYAAASAPPIESSPPQAEPIIWETNRPGCWRAGNCLVKQISFSKVYPKPFYQTDAFNYTLIAGVVATTATITVMTAGVGAPALVPGTSSLVVLIGGGSQGAYMAGLSTVGSLIGSNAVGGAAIINSFGAIIGLSSAAKSAAFGGLALKTMIGVSAAAYDGILIAENKKTNQLVFITELRLPTKVGSKWVKDLVTSIYENEEKAGNAMSEGKEADFARYLAYQQADLARGVRSLEACWAPEADCKSEELTRDDLIVLSIMAYKAGEFDLFHRTIDYVKNQTKDIGGSLSFLNHLYATSLLMQSNFSDAPRVLLDAIDQEPTAIEPALLYVVYLAETDFAAHEAEIESRIRLLEDQFDDDGYETAYSLATVYFRLGNIYAKNQRYIRALQYFEQAREALNFMQKWPIFTKFMNQQFRQDIELAMAIAYFRTDENSKAQELFNKLYEEQTDHLEKEALKETYKCSTVPDDATHQCRKALKDDGA